MLATCVLTVVIDRNISSAISEFVSPRATASAISRSRALRTSSPGPDPTWGRGAEPCDEDCSPSETDTEPGLASRVPSCLPCAVATAISRESTCGETVERPAAVSWTASTSWRGGVSLSMKPRAPASRASRMNESVSKAVSIRTSGGCGSARTSRHPSIPSTRGMRMSMRTTFGLS